MPSLPNRRRLTPSPGPSSATTPASLLALMGLCLWLVGWGLFPSAALAQFNGTNGIYALNHMLFGVMANNLTVATPGSGYVTSDTVTLDCPNTTTFNYTGGVYPVVTYNGTVWTLTNPGIAASIPSTGLAGGLNGVCLLTQKSTSGSGTGLTMNATFGFNAAALNGSNSTGGGSGSGSGNFLSVTNPLIGMVSGGADNATAIPALMTALGSTNAQGGQTVVFPGVINQNYTAYYFSKSLVLSRSGEYKCSGVTGSNTGGTELVFAAGVHGVVQEDGQFSSDGGYGEGTVEGCTIVSLGIGSGSTIPGATTITGVSMLQDPGGIIPASILNIGDGIVATAAMGGQTAGAAAFPAFAPGAYLSNVSGGTLTLAAGYTANANLNAGSNPVAIYQLPVAQKYTIQTTSGSNSVLVTAGPQPLVSGDVIWSDAFPFGSTVREVSTAHSFPQTVSIYNQFESAVNNATVTHTSGSPGQMWVIPAALKRDTAAKSSQNFFYQFPIGFEMACSSAGLGLNCTASHDTYNVAQLALVGWWIGGNNTGASDSVGEEGAHNYVADAMDGGTIGRTYVNFNSNSAESGSSLYSIIGNCGNDNYSVLIGGYLGFAFGQCAAASGVIPATAGTWPLAIGPTTGTSGGTSLVYEGNAGGYFTGEWNFDGVGTNSVCMNASPTFVLGISYNNCATFNTIGAIGVASGGYFSWLWTGLGEYERPFGSGYEGYTLSDNGGVEFPQGLTLSDVNDQNQDYIGMERLLDASTQAPTAIWHLRGDVSLTHLSSPGGTLGWANTLSFSTTLGGAVTGGTTTSVTVAACPSPALPAGTPIVAFQNVTVGSSIRLDQPLGKLSSCTSTTLTFQAAAAVSALNGTTIEFLQWKPAAPIAADTGGIIWPLGVPTAIASLPACGATTIGYAVVNNGTAYATGTYGSTVSATGALTRPIFCNGSNWVYD